MGLHDAKDEDFINTYKHWNIDGDRQKDITYSEAEVQDFFFNLSRVLDKENEQSVKIKQNNDLQKRGAHR